MTEQRYRIGSTVWVLFRASWTKAKPAHDEPMLQVPCEITAAKVSYGNLRYQVTPIGGDGQAWVDASRVGSYLWPNKGKESVDEHANKRCTVADL